MRYKADMDPDKLYDKALQLIPLDAEEGLELYEKAPLEELMFVANRLRQIHNNGNAVGWMIDRNVNLTNVCFSQCTFCNFCRKKNSGDAYVTSADEYIRDVFPRRGPAAFAGRNESRPWN
jgi:cyclic dehypoxanthinyl futalosine synthase